ncbi:hypothetical protein QTG54_006304 [Skeletonema marinoi]|uniref:Leucine-rich repeat domain-containing protein n=1 Tax=Skeletonema marinoi TaxID=267567 RepID=A0AAD9DCX2_9STRA|nr:hypothetical protein QTG54_006304 [Skeletonema marinoi]
MMQAAEDDEIFVYMGGDQVVPNDVRRVRIDRSVKVIPQRAFEHRTHLIDVEFHDDVEIIEEYAFNFCKNLRGPIKLLGVKIIEYGAFKYCSGLTDVEFGLIDLDLPEGLETIQRFAFDGCESLRRIAIPLNCTIGRDAFECGEKLATIDLVGGIHKTIASLHLERWRNDMKDEINQIHQILLDTHSFYLTGTIQRWIGSVIHKMSITKWSTKKY